MSLTRVALVWASSSLVSVLFGHCALAIALLRGLFPGDGEIRG